MKIDRRNPRHWLIAGLSLLVVIVAIVLRPLRRRGGRPRVVLYGHQLNGNVRALYRALQAPAHGIDAVFLTMDPRHARELAARGERCVLAASPRAIGLLAAADAVICDHGLQLMNLMVGRSDLKVFDVWHGIPFKGFDADDFRPLHRFDEAWVASPLLRGLYVERFGFAADRVHATGYARTDRLVRDATPPTVMRARLGLAAPARRAILFAPTWRQDAAERSLFPFGIDEPRFLEALAGLCERSDAQLLLRRHLNSPLAPATPRARVLEVPMAAFPDTEALLLASDLLVCDWSSIAFDFLLLDRPTIFLEVPPPFAKGLSLDRGHRFGAVVGSLDALLALLERYLADPAAYAREHGERARAIRRRVYGDCADGEATARCIARLKDHLAA